MELQTIRRISSNRTSALSARLIAPLLLSLMLGFGMVNASFAADLGSAKAQGLVGEKLDGYLGLVNANAPADVQQLVKSVNTKRRANYQAIAKKNNVSVDEVSRLTAQKVIGQAPKGTFVQNAGGAWQKK